MKHRMTKKLAKEIAIYIYETAKENTISDNYYISIDEIEECFEIEINFNRYEKICDTLFELYDDIIDLNEDDNKYSFEEGDFNITIPYGVEETPSWV